MNIETLLLLAFNAFLIQNIVLSQFLGICSFLGVSKKKSSALGMGAAVVFVITLSAVISHILYYQVLEPNGFKYMRTIVFILVIASLVQFVELVVKKYAPALYGLLGIYLPLVTTNCAVLGVAILVIDYDYDLFTTFIFSLFTSLGYMASIYIFSTIRTKLNDVPEGFKGVPIGLITAAIMSMILTGFTMVI